MKKIFLLAALIALVFCIAWASRPVFAASPWDDNFNDNVTDTNLWEHVYTDSDPATFAEKNGQLEWYINGAQMANRSITYITDKYVSKWDFDLSTDMTFKVDFSHVTSAGNGTGMNFGVYNGDMTAGSPNYQALIGVKNSVDPAVNNGTRTSIYDWAVARNGVTGGDGWFPRTDMNGTGVLSVDFYQSNRSLQLYGSNGPRINLTLPGNVTSLGVYLEGWASGGTTINHTNPSFFDNFSAAPEPISCVLFLVGGGALLGVRRFGKNKRT